MVARAGVLSAHVTMRSERLRLDPVIRDKAAATPYSPSARIGLDSQNLIRHESRYLNSGTSDLRRQD